ncbi:intraflagellar transport protein 25 homolog isoform X1 [Monodelphis domestica]|uniref:intraflagellar transport protein 25 homolog isoform X1 n=1 Tax=Monodelphis domestica TaxID=13616 RepID=UPI0024E21EC6|nr:intraflagellar transport protein 25 homolog isoform X1 [Monodelphis domestica]
MRVVDLSLSSEGTEVILATSSDEKYPPENIIDGNAATFWTTTGMFPQEFIICFHKHVKIERLSLHCYFVRSLRIEKSNAKEPVDFERWVERDLVHTEGQLQIEEFMVSSRSGPAGSTGTHVSQPCKPAEAPAGPSRGQAHNPRPGQRSSQAFGAPLSWGPAELPVSPQD